MTLHHDTSHGRSDDSYAGVPAPHEPLATPVLNAGIALIVGITGQIQDHLLTNPYPSLRPIGMVLPPVMVM